MSATATAPVSMRADAQWWAVPPADPASCHPDGVRRTRRSQKPEGNLADLLKGECEPGEVVVAEGEVFDLGMGIPAHVVVTDLRIRWAYAERPDVLLDIEFAKVSYMGEQDGAIKITQRRPVYVQGVNVSLNPMGETDLMVGYGTRTDVARSIVAGVKAKSDVWAAWRAAGAAFQKLNRSPVANWLVCPSCGASFEERVTHAVRCSGCGLYFSDPDFGPVVQEGGAAHGRLIGEEVWLPVFETDLANADWTKVWIVRPPEYSVGPLLVRWYDFEERESTV